MIDPLFGKYCYIDTPWIAGEKTVYKIVRSGVRSNGWREVPVKGRGEVVVHDWSEDVVFVVLDTLIDETSKIEKFALKDIELIDEPSGSEKPNNCECNTCRFSYNTCRFIDKGEPCRYEPKTEPQSNILLDAMAKAFGIEDEPQTDRSMAVGKRSDATVDKYNLYGKTTTDEPQKCENCNHYKFTCDLFSEICKYEPKKERSCVACWHYRYNGKSYYCSRLDKGYVCVFEPQKAIKDLQEYYGIKQEPTLSEIMNEEGW